MNCPFCGKPLAADDKIRQAHRFSHMSNGRPQGQDAPLAYHADCGDPKLPWRYTQLNPRLLKVERFGLIMPTAPSYQCLKCGEPFRRGDLIGEVLRVQEIDHDPVLGHPNVKVKEEAEYAHIRCDDRDGSKQPDRARIVL